MRLSAGRRRLVPLLAVVAGVMLFWIGWRAWEYRRDRRAMAEIEEEIANARHATASRKLREFLVRNPDSDTALYLLGNCELAGGRPQQAAEAWARVAPDSPFAESALLARMKVETERGRFSETEQIIRTATDDPRVEPSRVMMLIEPLYRFQGRLEDSLRLIESRWDVLSRASEGASEPAINLVRSHIDLQQNPMSVEAIRSILDQAASLAPDDDRVWLGKANLAIRTGSYEEAKRWLDACLRRRPDDVPVWRARLEWAVKTGQVASARDAMEHLPVAKSPRAEIPRLAAWLAARRRDRGAEQRALERLISVDPADKAALDRLADLALQEGQPALASELRSRKAGIERLEARYMKLYRRNQPTRDAVEMATLAEQLGRGFQARAYLTVAIDRHPDRDDLRRRLVQLQQIESTSQGTGRSLADVLSAGLDPASGPKPAPIHSEGRDEKRGSVAVHANVVVGEG